VEDMSKFTNLLNELKNSDTEELNKVSIEAKKEIYETNKEYNKELLSQQKKIKQIIIDKNLVIYGESKIKVKEAQQDGTFIDSVVVSYNIYGVYNAFTKEEIEKSVDEIGTLEQKLNQKLYGGKEI
jgi:hypothetical protein